MKLANAYARLLSIHNQFRISALSVSRLARDIRTDPTILRREGLLVREVRMRETRLEDTYVVRLFSEFEVTLRSACQILWPNARIGRTTVRSLIDRVAARQYILFDVLQRAHEVRRYRNALVHEAPRTVALTLSESRSRLAQFLSYLPLALLK